MTPEEIRALRKSTGLTQRQFAAKIPCSHHSIRAYEQGKRKPFPALIKLLKQVAEEYNER